MVGLDELLDGHLPSGVALDEKGVGTVADEKWRPVLLKAFGVLLA